MINFKKLNIKKIFRSLKTGVLSTNIFFFLLAVFFSTLALAVTLTVRYADNRMPLGVEANECFSSSRPAIDLDHDRTEDPRDVVWSDDGTMVFTINANMDETTDKGFMGDLDLSMNKARDPFELKTLKTSLTVDLGIKSHTCDDLDGFDVDHEDFQAQGMTNTTVAYRGIHISQGGRIFYILGSTTVLHRFDLTKPFDFKTAKYVNQFDIPSADADSINGFSISKDGTRLFAVDEGADADTPVLRTYSLSPAFDITSANEIHSLALSDPVGNSAVSYTHLTLPTTPYV